ncbi:hypothetical protein ASPZODRAFT_25200 [Penicilliopsis zonata CBS 506.65]|uniref:Uncharacterized protein n=1 Tax=Penicilliopsis zonata CBS 506.65 TaxID=1073090 RepID=A0A1L9SIR7_9EURO|nr:hypothetical protein ASPZODRAFT_25200 [Penicilliopsis zonata CBS 506.65]OJJ47122.1 hypothetical protein ASPZODRAFT_25200 [Penicilliopsis zonata CBS 506.65]
MSDSNLVDMEPGGESTQYESIRTVTVTPKKETGQLGMGSPHTKSEMSRFWEGDSTDTKPETDDEEWARQQNFGGFTGQFRGQKDRTADDDAAAARARRQQGYGPGSDVGA